jgi:hypothetical protein
MLEIVRDLNKIKNACKAFDLMPLKYPLRGITDDDGFSR